MSDQAQVKSFEAIEVVRAALLEFGHKADEGLTSCNLEMRRLVDWLEHNRPGFWEEQYRKAWDGVTQAKQDLNRCLMFPVGVNERPSCSEERAALKKAQAKLAYCEEKKEKLKHWIREIRHEIHTYEGRTAKLREVVDTDVPKGAATLGQVLKSLEEYRNLSKGSGLSTPTSSTKSGEVAAAEATKEEFGSEEEQGEAEAR